MTDKVLPTRDKKLSDQSKHLLRELEKMSVSATKLIPQLYVSLKDDGFDPKEARKIIEDKIELSKSQFRRLLPPEAKQMEHASVHLREPRKMRTFTSDIPHENALYTPDTEKEELKKKVRELEEDLRDCRSLVRRLGESGKTPSPVKKYGHPSPPS